MTIYYLITFLPDGDQLLGCDYENEFYYTSYFRRQSAEHLFYKKSIAGVTVFQINHLFRTEIVTAKYLKLRGLPLYEA